MNDKACFNRIRGVSDRGVSRILTGASVVYEGTHLPIFGSKNKKAVKIGNYEM